MGRHPQISPDGATVAFVRVTVNVKKDGYDTSIWAVASGREEPHRITSGNRDGSPRWSPDGKFLAFVRVTEKDGRPDSPQLFMLPMTGGEAWQFTSLLRGAGRPSGHRRQMDSVRQRPEPGRPRKKGRQNALRARKRRSRYHASSLPLERIGICRQQPSAAPMDSRRSGYARGQGHAEKIYDRAI